MFQRSNRMYARSSNRVNHDQEVGEVIRKHNRRAAKAAFAIALGVAIVLGGAAAAPAAPEKQQATPIIIGTKNFPEQYVLGQLYKQALEAKGFKVQYKENLGSTELIDASLRSGRVTLYPEYTGIMLSVTFKRKTLPASALGTYRAAKGLYEKRGQTLLKATPFQDRDGIAVLRTTASKYGLKTVGDLRKVPDLTLAAFPEFETRVAAAARKPLRRQERGVHAAGRDQLLHAAESGEDRGGGHLHDRPAADLDEVRGAEGAAQHVRLPAGRARCSRRSSSARTATKLTGTLNRVNSLLTLRAMIAMNKAVALDKKSAASVAKSFLKANGLS